jgi:endonuclease/exonuclease/phosphatase family metal-dependent hydrolase
MRERLRVFITVVVALAAAGCASAGRRPAPPLPIDVMTFNIRYGTAPDSANAWPHRRALLFNVVRGSEPEVLGVQEALRFQLDELRQAISRYAEVGVGREDGAEAGEYSAILYDTRRLELLDQGTFWFSSTPEVPGSKSWGNNITRICTWAHFRDRQRADEFYVYNVHWDHESQPSRDSSAVLLLRRITERADPSDPVIVMGDFNAGETNSAFRTLLTGGPRVEGAPRLLDTFRAVQPSARNVGTFHGFSGGTDGEKIDAVLVSADWEIEDADILRDAKDGRYPSDHFAVIARVFLRPN